MKKKLKFAKANDLGDTWYVENDEDDWLGTIMKSTVYKRRFVLKEVEYSAEFTSESLGEVRDFIDFLENRNLKNSK